MLSYRHAYHAGNFADVIKHVTLVAILEALARKDKPFYVQDSHAGRGSYSLTTAEATRHSEFADGIGRIWQSTDAPPTIARYLELVRACNHDPAQLRHYPGSPVISQTLLRDRDRLLLTELHPADHARLAERFKSDRRVQVHREDAYHGLKAWLPPQERRGLVLIDPAFERKDEYQRVIEALQTAYARWATGVYAIWYPVMSRELQQGLLDACTGTGIRKLLHAEFLVQDIAYTMKFVGCGMLIINPPWQLEQTLTECLDWLLPRLQQGPGASCRVEWLVGE